MDMDKLLALRTLAEEGTQIRAAEKLFCTQSALSKQINTLERELDCRLFDRKGSRLVLNDSGQKAYAYAVSCLDGYARLQEELAAAGQTSRKILYLGATNSIGGLPAPRRAPEGPTVPAGTGNPLHSGLPGQNRIPAGGRKGFPGNPAPGGGRKTARRLPGSSALSRGNGPGTAPGPPSNGQIRPLGGHMPPHHAGAGAGLRHPAVYRRADEKPRRGRPPASGLRQHRGHQAGG